MRSAFSDTLVDLALADPKLLLLTGDHGYALFDEFRRRCPDQFINAGIAEQNMVGMAAGLARVGYRPFVYALAAFVPIRAVEQIKLDIAHDNLPVVLIGDGAGFVYSHLGSSHQSTEDVACTRAIPGMTILSPADSFEMKASMQFAYEEECPVYLRVGKADLGNVHTRYLDTLKPGRLLKVREGNEKKLGLIATGSMVHVALQVGEELDLTVWSAPIIKPLSTESILLAAKDRTGLVTLEEHSVLAGLGGTIAEIVSQYNPIPILRLGVKDKFSVFCGTYKYLLEEHELDIHSIRKQVLDFSNHIDSH